MFSHLTKDFLGNKQSYSIGIIFISVGLLIGSWATFIPFVKAKFDLDDAQLGLLLLSLPFGALSMNSLGAALVRKIGMRKTTLMGLSAMLVSFSILLWSPVIPMLSVMLFLGGSSLSVTNVGMNTCVNAIEHQQKVKIMSTNHGMFSIGLMMGSILSSFFGALEIQPGVFMVFLTVILLFSMLFASTNINKIEDEKIESEGPKSKFSLPKGSFLLMILISICINVTEGTMADWSAVYMRDIVKTSSYFEGWGLAGYSLFMALGRFLGDKIIPMYGANKVLKYGGLTCSRYGQGFWFSHAQYICYGRLSFWTRFNRVYQQNIFIALCIECGRLSRYGLGVQRTTRKTFLMQNGIGLFVSGLNYTFNIINRKFSELN
jgi:fucose permease